MKTAAQYFFLLLLAAPLQGQQVASIDLTHDLTHPENSNSTQKSRDEDLPDGCSNLLVGGEGYGVVETQKGHKTPAIVTEIVRVSPVAPVLGSELEAEVRLRNRGKDPIQIPWTLEPDTLKIGPDPNHTKWEIGYFDFELNEISLISHTNALFSSELSTGSQLTIRPGEWIAAKVAFKLEQDPDLGDKEPFKIGKGHLSVNWTQALYSRDVMDCKVTFGSFYYEYEKKKPPFAIHLIGTANRSE